MGVERSRFGENEGGGVGVARSGSSEEWMGQGLGEA